MKVTCGADEPERSNQGFTVSATAVATGADVSLWLTGVRLAGAPSYVEEVLAEGVQALVY